MGTLKLDLELNKRNIMKKLIICILVLSPILVFSQNLTNNTNIAITKTWPQEPSGWTYPIAVDVPNVPVPQGGFPVCIALHGNGGNGNNSLNQFKKLHIELKRKFLEKKIFIHEVKYSPYHTDAKFLIYKKKSKFRKPGNLMIESLFKNWDIQRNNSFMIGDKKSDYLAAKKSNLKFYYPQKNFYKQIKSII